MCKTAHSSDWWKLECGRGGGGGVGGRVQEAALARRLQWERGRQNLGNFTCRQ